MIRVEDVTASYFTPAGPVQALDHVSLTIRDDEVLGIAGESGCGKSTLIKVIYQFVEPPLRLLSGRVEAMARGAGGEPVVLDGPALRRAWWRYISYIPQGSMSVLNPVARVGRQFLDAAGASAAFASRAELDARIAGYLGELNLPVDVLRAYPHQLSGGMRQRVIVALATFLHPRVILADEPTTALDVVVQRGIITMLGELQARERNTLVVVSHDMGVHYQLASRLAIMYAGKLVELADLAALVDRPLHPYTALLIGSLPRVGDRGRREGIGGRPPRLLDPPPGCRFAPRCPQAMAVCSRVDPPLREHDAGALGRVPSPQRAGRWPAGSRRRARARDARGGRMTAPLLSIDRVSRIFTVGSIIGGTRLQALDDVSLTLDGRQPTILSVVGESGSGKTTLARIILRLLEPSAGTVAIDGKPVHDRRRRPSDDEFRRTVQPIFQNPFDTFSGRKPVDTYLYETARNVQRRQDPRRGDADRRRRAPGGGPRPRRRRGEVRLPILGRGAPAGVGGAGPHSRGRG